MLLSIGISSNQGRGTHWRTHRPGDHRSGCLAGGGAGLQDAAVAHHKLLHAHDRADGLLQLADLCIAAVQVKELLLQGADLVIDRGRGAGIDLQADLDRDDGVVAGGGGGALLQRLCEGARGAGGRVGGAVMRARVHTMADYTHTTGRQQTSPYIGVTHPQQHSPCQQLPGGAYCRH